MDLLAASDFCSSGDEDPQRAPLAFLIERPTRKITANTVPRDGFEFIHKSRQEDLISGALYMLSPRQKNLVWNRKMADFFKKRAIRLQADEKNLVKNFPLKINLPAKDEKQWCLFCLGSGLYNEVYVEPCDEKVEANLPLLSIVSHLKQDMVKLVLRYLYRWFLIINMNESIALWVYSLLSYLKHPVDARYQSFLNIFKAEIRKRLSTSKKYNYRRLCLILTILNKNFSA
ncbi:uncharacterized protein TNCT_464001 [Trichonephila clavata]|uniref:Uncharacterized protein n=1 Tax=Trichonephila clavata TaxID=2740835 RepID=A0A8X6JHE9_TRICU|nr:uncharacterized protein TNCT_464001 [Trichonephila clavata]